MKENDNVHTVYFANDIGKVVGNVIIRMSLVACFISRFPIRIALMIDDGHNGE